MDERDSWYEGGALQALHPDGEQLELALGDVHLKLPWEGRSPRGLTRVALSPFFKAQAAKDARHRDPTQLDLFVRNGRRKPPELYRGASPLLPLPFERP